MHRREFVVSTLAGVVGLSRALRVSAQPAPITVDLGALLDSKALTLFNRTASRATDGARKAIHLGEAEGDGGAFLSGVEMANGTIDIDLRGKDVRQGSFLGVVFHGVDAMTYDAVYFRPFNFKAADPANRSHAVQYHSLPAYTWQRLRNEQPGKYEQPVSPAPDPNAWFHARVVVANPNVKVFVNGAADPCLSVTLLNDRTKGLTGLWVGNNSGGDFANLTITRAA